VVIGVSVVTALLAVGLTWFFMRKGARRQEGGRPGAEKPYQSAVGVAAYGASKYDWLQHLPQSLDDKTVQSAVKTLFDQVELHVENFYRDVLLPVTPEMQEQLQKVVSNNLPDSVAALLPQTRHSTALIKHCLAQLIVTNISTTNSVLLPEDYTALPQVIASTKSSSGTKPGTSRAASVPQRSHADGAK